MKGEPARKWWKEAVVYQIYPRSFFDSNGDGIGDLRGIIEKIEYISSLGVDVIWLNPVYKSPNDDNGYDISDYKDIMDEFGSMKDWEELLEEIHSRGMKLIMDLVVNHTSDEHEWFVKSRESLDNGYRDYYIWRDGVDGNPPNDWTSFFSGSAWQKDEKTGQYFLHLFTKRQPDLNWDNENVRDEVYEMMNWWLDKGIDGFRMDTVNMFSKVPGLPSVKSADGELRWGGEFFMNGPRIHEYLQEMNSRALAGRDIMTVGECPDVSPEGALDYVAPGRNELNMFIQFEHMGLDREAENKWKLHPFKLTEFKKVIEKWQTGLHGKGWNSNYLMNHDQPRALSRFGNETTYRAEAAKMLHTMLFSLEGTVYIYQGEEIGMINAGFDDIRDYRDVEIVNHYREAEASGEDLDKLVQAYMKMSRDNARTPMQWSAEGNAGFSSAKPWIKPGHSWREINVENDLHSEDSIIEYFRRLVTLRKQHPALVYGDFRQLLSDDKDLFVYYRSLDNLQYLVILNFSSNERELNDTGKMMCSENLLICNYSVQPEGSGTVIRPWEARIYKKELKHDS